ncbi:MAG: TatD family hydrolase [Alphaproteobacteria bacterium]
MLVDSHCHLDYPELAGDLAGVLARAAGAGVGAFLSIGTRLDRFAGVVAIAEAHPNVFCTVGVHPHEAGDEGQSTPDRILDATRHPKVVGIGETGLDYYYEHSPRDAQIASFRAHIAAARISGLPVVVHTRDADTDTAEILADEYRRGPFNGLIHCFTSSPELARTALDIGFCISFSGIVTFKSATAIADVARTVPADRLLVETDAPFLAPVPKRGKTNEPAFVAFTAARLADIRGVGAERVAALTTANFFRLFAKARMPGPASP